MLPALLIVLCAVFRVVPHPPNFAPVGATRLESRLPWVPVPIKELAVV